jgi:integrase
MNRRLAILRRVANLAYDEWHWLDRPIAVRLLAEHNQRHEYLNQAEVRELAKHCPEPINHMVIIASYTGMRESEILGLTKANIRGDTIFLGLTKNGKPKSLPIAPLLRPHLMEWIKVEKEHPRTLYKKYKKALNAIGRGSVTFHDLRHTAASFLLNAGYDLATVAEVLNCTIQNAQRYAHLSLENKRNALFSISAQGQGGEKLAVKASSRKLK